MTANLLTAEKTASLRSAWQMLRDHLEAKKSQIAVEILYYPPPIPACDAQFNFLLEERARLDQVLGQIDIWADGAVADDKQVVFLDEFLAASDDLNEAEVQEIRLVMARVWGE